MVDKSAFFGDFASGADLKFSGEHIMSPAELAARVLSTESFKQLFASGRPEQSSAENPIVIDLGHEAMCAVAPGSGFFEKSWSKLETAVPTAAALLRSARIFEVKTAVAASLTSSTSTISFGDVKVNNTSPARYFSLTNSSACPVNYSISTPYGFYSSPTSGTVQANSSASISVTFNPTYEQNYSGYVNITPGTASVYVSGKGVK